MKNLLGRWELGRRNIHCGRRPIAQVVEGRVGGDADDGPLARAESEYLADGRRLVRVQPPRERPTDHHDRRVFRPVLPAQPSTRQHRHTHGLEVPITYDDDADPLLPGLGLDRHPRTVAGQSAAVAGRHGGDAGDLAELLDECRVVGTRLRWVVSEGGRKRLDLHQIRRHESGVSCRDPIQRLAKERRAHDERQRKRQLADYQQLFGVPAFDAATYIGAVGLLGLVSMLAIVWPVRQALRVHPVLALLEE